MTRVAILGANGQVGSEVALRLRQVPGMEVVPVARNPSGSAFLRLNGMTCRHGRIGDPAEARNLIGDCDLIVNFALSTSGPPSTDRRVNRQIVRNAVDAAKTGAVLVFASTIMVYAPNMPFWLPDAYGLEKRLAERLFRRLCQSSAHDGYILRLGHVLGDLQNITQKIQDQIKAGPVTLPHGGTKASNTVLTATIVDALCRIVEGKADPGTYDLMSSPQWTWLDVYRYYAMQLGLELRVAPPSVGAKTSGVATPGRVLRGLLGFLRDNQLVRERLSFLFGFLPEKTNHRIRMRYLQARALREINALSGRSSELAAPDWRELRVRGLAALCDPIEATKIYPLRLSLNATGK